MPHPALGFLDRISTEARGLRSDLVRMVELRLELARLEAETALSQLKWLTAVLVACGVLLLSGLVLLLVLAAQLVARWLELPQETVLAWQGGGLTLLGAAIAWLAYRRFRQQFRGLNETLAELREDLVWLKEWTERETPDAAGPRS